jgi:glycosyltransferase involved in cell wall biosynthesis
MNVCIVSQEYPPETDWGGIGTYTRHLARGLASRGHNITVVSRSVTEQDVATALDGSVRVIRVFPRRLRHLRGRRVLGRFIACLEYSAAVARTVSRIEGIDVIEYPNWNAEGFWHLMGRRRGPVVTRVHSPYAAVLASREERVTLDKRLSVALERMAVRRSDIVATHSHHNARLAARLYGLDAARIPVIPHGIPLSEESPAPDRNAPPRVLYLGRLEHRKGIHVLLDALPEVLDAVPAAEIVIAGRDSPSAPGGRTWREHAETALTPAHRARTRFLGYVDEETARSLYDECDLFVAPSLYESFGLVYLEAMARGRAVIGSRVSAIPEVVADGETGLLPPPGDPRALATAIIRLLRDPGERVEMGRRGRERVKRFFSDSTMVERVIELYEQATGARR